MNRILILPLLFILIVFLVGCSATPASETSEAAVDGVSSGSAVQPPAYTQELTGSGVEPGPMAQEETQPPVPSVEPESTGGENPLLKYPIADVSHYEGVPSNTIRFRTMTVKDIVAEMEAGSTFAVIFGFENCPHCIYVMPVLYEVLLDQDVMIGYVDCRADRSWKSNKDIADYDLLCEYLGSYFAQEDEGPHLYVPQAFYISDGEVVFNHNGSKSSVSDPDERRAKVTAMITEGFGRMQLDAGF